ncbi:rhamnogalacturonan acetylesterase [Mesonia aestuariivivens]|uniref:Rhamnogalacturonan acetylesterase n=1 Tax=Mesonia aestuariivivens TaxID=2796128 RepID=A0ABS6W1P0_9FLAO|nr:rhamnogalacturonan acetylesterase [Mesonia aestuariivivens]MBW2961756.1 rhamnogalacturonan acetylesterase [Mesonia aestuariivivens]
MKVLFSCIFILISIHFYAQEKPTLYLIGDSTMADKKNPEENPEHGWGQMLPELMTNKITIENHAVNGRSTKSFLNEGRWKTIYDQLKPGDFVIIQFGHNDQKINSPDRYTNPFTAYRYNLEKFVNQTREKGATPILMSSIVRRNFNKFGTFVDTHGSYPLVVRMLGKELDVPFIDMQWLTEQLEEKYGEEDSRNLHLHFAPGEVAYYEKRKDDDTHLSKMGATLVATLALKEIAKKDLDLKKYIKNQTLKKQIL